MELGEKLRKARLEAKLSQRALCEDVITRNMLSQIENGSARPSMKTLRHLASRLGKPVSFFLEDAEEMSPNQARIRSARESFDAGDWEQTISTLQAFQLPDPVFDREFKLLWVISHLHLAEEAIACRRFPYARELLAQAAGPVPYCAEDIRRRYLLLLSRLGEPVSGQLPSLDEELLLRAEEALGGGNYSRAAALLEAMEERSSRWHLRKGQTYLAREAYAEAVKELLLAEPAYPKETVPQLELAFRELRDYEKAYLYACKRRN